MLEIEGINDTTTYETKLYKIPIKDKNNQTHILDCYGLDKISSEVELPDENSYANLCHKLGVHPEEVRRPKKIDLLISQREAHLMSDDVKSQVNKIKLYDGPLGQTISGTDPDLKFPRYNTCYPTVARQVLTSRASSVRKAITKRATLTALTKTDKEILKYFKEESIGVECEPKCGNCQCGKCALGSKQMSLKDEKEYNKMLEKMIYDEDGTKDDPGPYWRVSYVWLDPRESLPENYKAVLGVMNSTARKLGKDPAWREVYENQLRDLVKNKFAREISEKELYEWKMKGNKSYYIAHQMALNPGSKSTPVRTVFNSSQVYQGYSLNSSWALGPDIMNNLHGILLRFREDVVAGQGDIKKMYYMVRVTKEEEFMQLFIWKFRGEDKIRTFAMGRLVMGNKPSSNYSQISLKETTKLKDFPSRYPTAEKALTEDSYVDNTFVTAPDIEKLHQNIEEVETVAKEGGFFYKPWIISGEDVPHQIIGVQLPNAIAADKEKALGVGWDVKEDKFYIEADISIGNKKNQETISLLPQLGIAADAPYLEEAEPLLFSKKDHSEASPFYSDSTTSLDPLLFSKDAHSEVSPFNLDTLSTSPGANTKVSASQFLPLKLTVRICLSIHSKAFDPLGLVLPTRMVGNLLFRETLQFLKQDANTNEDDVKKNNKKENTNKIKWDQELNSEITYKWEEYFRLLHQLKDVKFPRSIKPENIDSNVKPKLVTFSDGNPNAYGSCAYALWTLADGTKEARLIMSKAKLSPLLSKGETVRNELAGATYASRLLVWIKQHTSLEFG